MRTNEHEYDRRWWSRRLAVLVGVVLTAGCTPAAPPAPPAPADLVAEIRAAAEWTSPIARSREGMVVTGSPLATAVGVRMLEQGGNAVDAAVAAAFALSVVEPTMSGIGGRTQMLIRSPTGEFFAIDGTTEVPTGYPPDAPVRGEDAYGYETIGIPGTVAALDQALSEHGTLSLTRILAPAIALAETGFPLPAAEAGRIAEVAGQLREFEGSRRHFLRPDGSPMQGGEQFVQPALARTLQRIAEEGAKAFYTGEIAAAMVSDITAKGGYLGQQDLAAYRATPSIVVRGRYRDRELVGSYLPASGATTIEALQIMGEFDLPPIAGSAAWAAVVTQALRLAFEDRERDFGTDSAKAMLLTSGEWAERRAREVHLPGALPAPAAVPRRAPHSAPRTSLPVSASTAEPAHTTHLSVADADGWVVALTQSIGPIMGSKVAAPELGFVYAATMGYLGELEPGERPWSSQSPLIILRGGQPEYVLGAAGARRIISAIVEVASRALDQNLAFGEAMAAPRFHPGDEQVTFEHRPGVAWSEAVLDSLRAWGFEVRTRSDPPFFARIHGISFDAATGEFIGVADARWQGSAGAPR